MRLSGDPARWLARLAARAPGEVLVARSVPEMRALRLAMDAHALAHHGRLARVGFVPTMGALHAGHLSLCGLARSGAAGAGAAGGDVRSDFLVASIFVNPTQFAPHEDLATYPRTWDADVAALSAAGADAVFAPTAGAMYPPAAPHRTFVELAGVDGTPEGAARPGFFRGVATVVTKLLTAVAPTVAAFGQKDGIQCIVVKQLVRDLNLPVTVLVGATTRELDGLAMSSRNVYLTAPQRAAAPAIYRALGALVAEFHGSQEGRAQLAAAVDASTVTRAGGAVGGAPSAEQLAQRAAAMAQATRSGGSGPLAGDASGPPLEPFLASLVTRAVARIAHEVRARARVGCASAGSVRRTRAGACSDVVVQWLRVSAASAFSSPHSPWGRRPPIVAHIVPHAPPTINSLGALCRAPGCLARCSTCGSATRSTVPPLPVWGSPQHAPVLRCCRWRSRWAAHACWTTSCSSVRPTIWASQEWRSSRACVKVGRGAAGLGAYRL